MATDETTVKGMTTVGRLLLESCQPDTSNNLIVEIGRIREIEEETRFYTREAIMRHAFNLGLGVVVSVGRT